MECTAVRKSRCGANYRTKDLTPEVIAETLKQWDRETLLAMAEKAKSVAITDATERVANVIIEVAKK